MADSIRYDSLPYSSGNPHIFGDFFTWRCSLWLEKHPVNQATELKWGYPLNLLITSGQSINIHSV